MGLLRGLVWDQHYRHSHPQCEGSMPGSFELRTDMAPDRLQAVEDWLRAERFAFRFQQRRWRTWTCNGTAGTPSESHIFELSVGECTPRNLTSMKLLDNK